MKQNPEAEGANGSNDVAMELAFSSFKAPTAQGFAERFRALEKARSSLLEDSEYREWREGIFTDLASPKSFAKTFGVILYPLTALALAAAAAGYLAEIRPLLLGGAGLTLVLVMTTAVLAFVHRRHRGLSHFDRLQIVDYLLANSIVTQEEAYDLRKRINQGQLS